MEPLDFIQQKEVQLLITLIAGITFSLIANSKKWFSTSSTIVICFLALIIVIKQDIFLLTFPFLFALIGSILSTKDFNKEKNGRTVSQVLANAAPAIIFLFLIKDTELARNMVILVFAIALSDTMSSELGKKWNGTTIDMCSLKKIEPGLSGGISWQGSVAGILGSSIIAFSSFIYNINLTLFLSILIFGFMGMLIDSYLGSVAQGKYFNGAAIKETGTRGELIRGIHWLNNELVNFLSILITCAIAYPYLMSCT